eukprot:CAMPEP_0113564700 /NCGR_PEP_ID=MMETSP0015_2-20120614/21764_1 /TAXON_ID=2838 /ORGANISM="Odontella" /LENGTH=315 /DNA_ID=CAMNT_0000466809 /DNA_START=173 /DNA_END=1120 /DNA_ORIENTATION=+ /assembly_acc=CAM_ASM_000160
MYFSLAPAVLLGLFSSGQSLASSPIQVSSAVTEQNRFWDEVLANCPGCWSGAIVHTAFEDSKSPAFLRPTTDKLNFRLKVDIQDDDRDHGTWTVNNVEEIGDERVIPLARHPTITPPTHKIAFDGVTLRTSRSGNLGIDIGFWHREGDTFGMRRSVVVTYNENDAQDEQSQKLDEIVYLQQKLVPSDGFVGNTVVPSDKDVMLDEVGDLITSESGFEMKSAESLKREPLERGLSRAKDEHTCSRLLNSIMEDHTCRFRMILPNRIAISLPLRIVAGETNSCLFAHERTDGSIQIVEIDFEGEQTAGATMFLLDQL